MRSWHYQSLWSCHLSRWSFPRWWCHLNLQCRKLSDHSSSKQLSLDAKDASSLLRAKISKKYQTPSLSTQQSEPPMHLMCRTRIPILVRFWWTKRWDPSLVALDARQVVQHHLWILDKVALTSSCGFRSIDRAGQVLDWLLSSHSLLWEPHLEWHPSLHARCHLRSASLRVLATFRCLK